jgi:hypothetical protein
MENKLEKRATFQTLSNSVNIQMQSQLIEEWEPFAIDDYGQPLNISRGIEPTSTALAMAIARLHYKADTNKFQETRLAGILCFIVD